MLQNWIEKQLSQPEVQSVASQFVDKYPAPDSVVGNALLKASQVVSRIVKQVAVGEGLPNLKPPKPAPLSDVYVVRALVMLRVIYHYELYNGVNTAPSQDELCTPTDYGGLLTAAYEQLGLAAAGYLPDNACKGAPHVQLAAHILSDTGLMIERGNQANVKRRGAPYQITSVGRMYAFYMFGDQDYVKSGKQRGWTGVPALSKRSGIAYSPWITDVIGLETV